MRFIKTSRFGLKYQVFGLVLLLQTQLDDVASKITIGVAYKNVGTQWSLVTYILWFHCYRVHLLHTIGSTVALEKPEGRQNQEKGSAHFPDRYNAKSITVVTGLDMKDK